MSSYRIVQGDVLETLRGMQSGSVDAVLCDPPYGLSSSEKRNMRRASPRKSSRDVATGFMGMEWDAAVPDATVWRELLRVLIPGGPLLAFGGTRTFHRLMCAIEDGGFILADTLCWLHSQGFPKSKAQLKPAWEPITLAFKPGPRALNIDGCRTELVGVEKHATHSTRKDQTAVYGSGWKSDTGDKEIPRYNSDGRWPANVILDPESAELLDQQTGILTSGANPERRHSPKTRNTNGEFQGQEACVAARGSDSGGASRFYYVAKARESDRGEGNTHPTCKPTALTERLARLIRTPGANALLVPYCGSGSEMIGALRAGWGFVVGIEREGQYIDIAERRIPLAVPGATGHVHRQEKRESHPLFAEAAEA